MPQLDLHSLVTLAPILALLSLALASLALELNLRLAAAAKALARLTTPSAAAASPKEAAAAPRLRPFAASAASAGRRGLSTEPPKGFHSTYHVLLEKSPVSGLFPDGGLPPGEPWDGFQFWGCRLALLDALGVVHQPTLTSAELLRGKNLSFEARLLARVLFQSWEPRTPVTLEGLLQLMLLVTARGTLALRLNIELSRGEADKGPPRSALELLARVLPSARDLAEEVIRLRRSPEAPGPEALHHDQFLLILAEQRLLSALEKGWKEWWSHHRSTAPAEGGLLPLIPDSSDPGEYREIPSPFSGEAAYHQIRELLRVELFFTLRALFSREQENSPDQLCHWLGGFTPSPAEAAFTEEFLAGAADCQRGCFFAEKLPSHWLQWDWADDEDCRGAISPQGELWALPVSLPYLAGFYGALVSPASPPPFPGKGDNVPH